MILVMQSWWVGVRVKQDAFVSAQWKHSLRDGEPLAGHFSCCGQRFPWQVSLNSSFVFGDGFSLTSCVLKTLWCSLLQGLDWSPMTRSWLKTNTKPCESELLHWDATCFGSVMQSVGITCRQIRATPAIHYFYPDTQAVPKIVESYISPQLNRDPQEWTRPHFDHSKFSDALMQTGDPHFIINPPPKKIT